MLAKMLIDFAGCYQRSDKFRSHWPKVDRLNAGLLRNGLTGEVNLESPRLEWPHSGATSSCISRLTKKKCWCFVGGPFHLDIFG